ncbi:beta-lactamase family protein [Kribbella sandramycini]|uniref:Beta-lactamase family protein n=1 Tax=Kribbella sandramycini TaxID=60450 RepID=A0A7Y4L675_9ACTN|nr:serine hydrolase domain-containing protein [Kribbella sandramycini]MBB6566097.1 D-alanyl-D-alanine carboxypeptidase [Kribbella sandramycini]NOL45097.1 beta-lactamase family protein [Kribbella sandramycini]
MVRLQAVLDSLISGGAAGVLLHYRDGEGEWSGSAGVAEVGTGRAVDPEGCFRVGSITKTFTATVVLQLVGEGVLGLGDSVERWLPGMIPTGAGITLLHLLNHTSGLYNYVNDLPDTAGIVRDRYVHWDPARAVDIAVQYPVVFKPGTAWSYSNTNYTLLGLIIEAATGRSYEAEVEARILQPLDLKQTYLPGDTTALPEPHAHAYLAVGDDLVDTADVNVSQAWAAGALVSTARDLNTFYTALLSGALLRETEQQALLTTVPTAPDASAESVGPGLFRIVLAEVDLWGHTGGIFGYETWSYHSLDGTHHLTLSLTNAGAPVPETAALFRRLLG